jgi:hypothetical protein
MTDPSCPLVGRDGMWSDRPSRTQIGGGHQIDFEPTVHSAGGDDYKVATSQSMHEQTLKGVEQGATVQVKVDADDPQSLLASRDALTAARPLARRHRTDS